MFPAAYCASLGVFLPPCRSGPPIPSWERGPGLGFPVVGRMLLLLLLLLQCRKRMMFLRIVVVPRSVRWWGPKRPASSPCPYETVPIRCALGESHRESFLESRFVCESPVSEEPGGLRGVDPGLRIELELYYGRVGHRGCCCFGFGYWVVSYHHHGLRFPVSQLRRKSFSMVAPTMASETVFYLLVGKNRKVMLLFRRNSSVLFSFHIVVDICCCMQQLLSMNAIVVAEQCLQSFF
jgi:hypothetical protein